MKRDNTGSALVDYIVPTALVGIVVGLGLFGILKSGVLANFFAASGNIDINSGKAVMNSNNPSSQPLVSSVGTENITSSAVTDKPLIKGGGVDILEDGTEIDYGDFVLKGIPEDFGEYIESTGNSGGTDLLANLIKQIALEANIDDATQNLLITLANNGHSIAELEKSIEDEAKTGIQEYEDNGSLSGFSYPINDSLASGSTRTSFDSSYTKVIETLSSSSDPNARSLLDSIKVLGNEIQFIADDMDSVVQTTVDATDSELTLTLDDMLQTDGSKRTDIDSALICVSGNGQDSGTQCNN